MPERRRAFEIFLRQVRPFVIQHHGESLANEIIDATRVEYERVRPNVPDIGGLQNVYQPVMAVNGWIVALYRAMSARGLVARDAVRVCQEAFETWLERMPGWLLRAIGRLMSMGIDASETIGTGRTQCALRFKHGRETRVPANLEGVIRETV